MLYGRADPHLFRVSTEFPCNSYRESLVMRLQVNSLPTLMSNSNPKQKSNQSIELSLKKRLGLIQKRSDNVQHEKEICLLILEKAVAKYVKGYFNTQHVSLKTWFEVLTGGYVRSLHSNQVSGHSLKIALNDQKCLVVANAKPGIAKRMGLVGIYVV